MQAAQPAASHAVGGLGMLNMGRRAYTSTWKKAHTNLLTVLQIRFASPLVGMSWSMWWSPMYTWCRRW